MVLYCKPVKDVQLWHHLLQAKQAECTDPFCERCWVACPWQTILLLSGAEALDRKQRKQFDAWQLQTVKAVPQKSGRVSAAIGKGTFKQCTPSPWLQTDCRKNVLLQHVTTVHKLYFKQQLEGITAATKTPTRAQGSARQAKGSNKWNEAAMYVCVV